MVERGPEKAGVGGSIPSLATTAHLIESIGDNGNAKVLMYLIRTQTLPMFVKTREFYSQGSPQSLFQIRRILVEIGKG